jgi:hypothetical protein
LLNVFFVIFGRNFIQKLRRKVVLKLFVQHKDEQNGHLVEEVVEVAVDLVLERVVLVVLPLVAVLSEEEQKILTKLLPGSIFQTLILIKIVVFKGRDAIASLKTNKSSLTGFEPGYHDPA